MNAVNGFMHMLTTSASAALIVKLTLILAVAAVLAVFLRSRSAAARHYVWALAITTCLAIPFATAVAPTVPVPIAAPSEAVMTFSRGATSRTALESPPQVGALTTIDAPRGAVAARVSAAMVITIAWLAGAALVFAWLVLGHVGMARLTRKAQPVTDESWLAALAGARAELEVRRRVQLLSSSAVGAPITRGFLRPVVLLPLAAREWTYDRCRVVLQHELAHIARHDYLLQLFAGAACALYWFHPGMWAAARRLRYESERACDDDVLALGSAPTDYAAHLLSVASGARALRLTGGVAIGMARRSALEGRLLAALDPHVRRSPLSRKARLWSAVALGIGLLPLAGMRPVNRPVTHVFAAKPSDDSTFERSVRAAAGERLYLDLRTGGDVSVRGWDEPRVQVRVTLGGLNWRDIAVDIGRDQDGVLVEAQFERRRNSQSSRNTFEIRVPRRFDVRLKSGGGDLTIMDVEGRFEGTSGGGAIVLERLRGQASLSTGGGDIRVEDVNLSGHVSTGGGVVVLSRVSGGLRGSSGSGPVMYGERGDDRGREDTTADLSAVRVGGKGNRITLGSLTRAGSAPTLHIEKAGGSIELEEAPSGAVISTGGGDVRVGRGAGVVEASTGGGDVTIGPVAGSVKAGTGAGTVHVTLTDSNGEEQNVEIHAGVGRVILELPANFDGRFEIETAYTRRFGRATRIESDWDLARETTDEWDDSQGTPRRYVRGTGTAGRGRGLVYIKTVNGDITIRRGR